MSIIERHGLSDPGTSLNNGSFNNLPFEDDFTSEAVGDTTPADFLHSHSQVRASASQSEEVLLRREIAQLKERIAAAEDYPTKTHLTQDMNDKAHRYNMLMANKSLKKL